MPSSVAKGTYYKTRTKKWLEKNGYAVGSLEKMFRIFRPGGAMIFTKQDQFGSDLLAMNLKKVVFVQVKLNRKNIAIAHKEFAKFPFPKSQAVEKWIVVWEPRGREPEVIVVK